MIAILRAGRWPVAIGCWLALIAVEAMSWSLAIRIPLLEHLVPGPTVVVLIAITACATPLHTGFGWLEQTWTRRVMFRCLAAIGTATMIVSIWLPTRSIRFAFNEVSFGLLCLLMILGYVAVVLLGEYAWVITFLASFGALRLMSGDSIPLDTALDSVPAVVWALLLIAAAAGYVALGPASSRLTSPGRRS